MLSRESEAETRPDVAAQQDLPTKDPGFVVLLHRRGNPPVLQGAFGSQIGDWYVKAAMEKVDYLFTVRQKPIWSCRISEIVSRGRRRG